MRFSGALTVVGFTGFIALAYEMVWFRAYSFVSRTSPAAFGILLGSYLGGLALGALASRRWCTDSTAAGNPEQLRTLAVFVLLANVLGFLVVPSLAWIATFMFWGFSLPMVALSAGMLGATLPTVAFSRSSSASVAPASNRSSHSSVAPRCMAEINTKTRPPTQNQGIGE